MDQLQWAMISSMSFNPQTDLQVEVMSLQILGVWTSSAFVNYQGRQYHLNEPELFEVKMAQRGDITDGARFFSAEIITELGEGLHLQIECSAPVEKFALLETEGATQVRSYLAVDWI